MEPVSARGSHVLLVDDDRDNLEIMSELLALEGIQAVSCARTLAEAVKVLAQDFAPSAIVLDLALGKERGESLIARLQEDPSLPKVPVIALSGDEAALAQIRESVAQVLLKPADPAELVHALAVVGGAGRANEGGAGDGSGGA